MKENFAHWISGEEYVDTPSGLLQFLRTKVLMCHDRRPIRELFLEVFPSVTINLYKLLEETTWIYHPAFKQHTAMEEF